VRVAGGKSNNNTGIGGYKSLFLYYLQFENTDFGTRFSNCDDLILANKLMVTGTRNCIFNISFFLCKWRSTEVMKMRCMIYIFSGSLILRYITIHSFIFVSSMP
jgi:hypothetical protein